MLFGAIFRVQRTLFYSSLNRMFLLSRVIASRAMHKYSVHRNHRSTDLRNHPAVMQTTRICFGGLHQETLPIGSSAMWLIRSQTYVHCKSGEPEIQCDCECSDTNPRYIVQRSTTDTLVCRLGLQHAVWGLGYRLPWFRL